MSRSDAMSLTDHVIHNLMDTDDLMEGFKAFLEKRYKVKVVMGTHPIPKKYLDMHSQLGTWNDPAWKPLLELIMTDEATRASYD